MMRTAVLGIAAVGAFALVLPTSASATGNDCAPNNVLEPEAEFFASCTTDETDNSDDPRLDDRIEPFES